MEAAIVYEIEHAIPELSGKTVPTHAPVGSKPPPYLVYHKQSKERLKTLDGYIPSISESYTFNIMSERYEHMKALTDKAEALIMSFANRNIGADAELHVEDVKIDNTDEIYEYELKLERGIIDFTVYY